MIKRVICYDLAQGLQPLHRLDASLSGHASLLRFMLPLSQVSILTHEHRMSVRELSTEVIGMFDNVSERPAGPAKELQDFKNAFVDSALQRPGNAVREIYDWAFNTHTPELEIVEPPKDNTLGAQLGNIAGQAVNIYLLSRTFSLGTGITSVGAAENALRFGAAGFAHGSLFQSTADQSGNFLINRAANGIVEGGTWAVIGGLSSALTKPGIPMFRNGFAANVASGGTGGIANAELDAVINHRRLATGAEIKSGILTYAAAGAITGGLNWRSHSAAMLKGQELSPHLVNRYTSY